MLATKRLGAVLIGLFAVAGCAGSEPSQDAAEVTTATDQAATQRAPEDVEAKALLGHSLTVDERIDIPALRAGTKIGYASIPVGREYDVLTCSVVLWEKNNAAVWIDPGRYQVSKVVDMSGYGYQLELSEADGTTPADFVVSCLAMARPPLAREMRDALKSKITLDPAVFGPTANP